MSKSNYKALTDRYAIIKKLNQCLNYSIYLVQLQLDQFMILFRKSLLPRKFLSILIPKKQLSPLLQHKARKFLSSIAL